MGKKKQMKIDLKTLLGNHCCLGFFKIFSKENGEIEHVSSPYKYFSIKIWEWKPSRVKGTWFKK